MGDTEDLFLLWQQTASFFLIIIRFASPAFRFFASKKLLYIKEKDVRYLLCFLSHTPREFCLFRGNPCIS